MFFVISINGYLIQQNTIKSLMIMFSMESHLPVFQMTFLDKEGTILSLMPFAIGSPITVTVYSVNDTTNKSSINSSKELIKYNFVLAKFNGDDASDHTHVGGYFNIIGVHPWQFFKDYTPHCYPSMKISDLVKKVVNDNSRGYELSMDEESADTDGTCKHPQYKTNESDLDFILNKIVPYATINNAPIYFYANEKNKIVLNSFQMLINKDIKAVLSPFNIDNSSNVEEIKTLLENFGLDAVTRFTSIQYTIGGGSEADYVKKLLPKFYVEDLMTHKMMTAVKSPTSKMAKSTATYSGNKVPIFDTTFGGLNQTSSTVLMNRETDDQINLAINYTRDLDKMFRLTVDVAYNQDITIGSVVYLYIPTYITNTLGAKTVHWATGKWLVYQAVHSIGLNGENAGSELTLIRPSFAMNEIKTTLSEPENFLEV